MLKTQDLVIALYLRLHRQRSGWTYASLAESVGVTQSQCFEAVKRARACQLMSSSVEDTWSVSWMALKEFIGHGVRFVFPAQLGPYAQGWPTVHSAAWVQESFLQSENDHTVVWPDPEGPERGESLLPLHKSVPYIIARPEEKDFYQLMCALDLVRMGQARERQFAMKYMESILAGHANKKTDRS